MKEQFVIQLGSLELSSLTIPLIPLLASLNGHKLHIFVLTSIHRCLVKCMRLSRYVCLYSLEHSIKRTGEF